MFCCFEFCLFNTDQYMFNFFIYPYNYHYYYKFVKWIQLTHPLLFFTPSVGLMVGPVQQLGGYSLPAGDVFAGRYSYIGDLMTLESCVPPTQPIQWPRGLTPVFIDRLLPYLSFHPDRLFVQYIHSGFIHVASILDLTGAVLYYILSLLTTHHLWPTPP